MIREADISLEDATNHWIIVHKILKKDIKYLNKYTFIKYSDLTENYVQTTERIYLQLSLDNAFDMSNKIFKNKG